MRFFETRWGNGVGQEIFQVQPYREALWSAAFGVQQLDDLFDLTTAKDAVPIIDAAILRFNHSPDELRPLHSPEDPLTLRHSRMCLEQMRATLVDYEAATISGVIDDGKPVTT